MQDEQKYDVFISYSRRDYVDEHKNVIPNNVVSRIKDALSNAGITYWFDEDGIYSGDEFAGVITRAIRTSKIFLFVSSVYSNQSLWTSNEISTALEYGKTIIPFRLDNSPYNDSVMMKIVSLDRIDCDDHEMAIAKLLRAIRHHIPEKDGVCNRIFEFPQSVKGATVIMDVGERKVEQIMCFDVDNPDNGEAPIETLSFPECPLNPYLCEGVSNDISVHIADKKTPVVMLVGPTAVGKTMTLVRLVRYLSEMGYTVYPDRTFRPVSDTGYKRLCDSFQELINGAYAAPGTGLLDCLLVKILKNGRSIMQIVDLAGETIMNLGSEKTPSYLYQLFNLENPITWVIMIEPYWADMNGRREFVEKIRELKKQYISSKDKIIIIVNKIDKTPFLEGRLLVDSKGVFDHIRAEYPGLMEIFLSANPIVKLFKPYDCALVPFMSGRYTTKGDGSLLYVPSAKEFPQILLKELLK